MIKLLDWLRLPDLKKIANLDDVSTILLHKEIIRKKPFLRQLYLDFYRDLLKTVGDTTGKKCIEVGSGRGFLKEIAPHVITSDILDLPSHDMRFSGLNMPFSNATVDVFFLLDVFHHVHDSPAFLRELDRCLKPGGKVVLIEPATTPWSRIIFRNFHHEPFDPEGRWTFETTGPLSGANGALPWIVFVRDRERFEKEFPQFRVKRIRPHTPFRYLLSGGFSLRQLLPSIAYHPVAFLEKILSPLNNYIGMFMTIELEKRRNSTPS